MKRLFTILVGSVAAIGLYAQSVPMAIYGDVYNKGDLLSIGEVHIKADTATSATPERVGRMDNYGHFKIGEYSAGNFTSKIVFYSNRRKDGLLRNDYVYDENCGCDIITPHVSVRKNIDKNNAWFTMSLPFDVDINNGIINPITKSPLGNRGTNFEVQYYDAQLRANSGTHGEQNWKPIPGSKITRGIAFRFAVEFSCLENPVTKNNYDIEFVAQPDDWPQIYNMLRNDDKGNHLVHYDVPSGLFTPGPNPPGYYNELARVGAYNSDGWNTIGGLNSDLFNMDEIDHFVNINVFYIKDGDPSGKWTPYKINDHTLHGTLRPYAALFVKAHEANSFFKYDGTNPNDKGFKYKKEGNTLNITNSSLILRSSEEYYDKYDLFRIDVTSVGDEINRTPVYFQFNDEYSSFYKGNEDQIMFSTTSNTDGISAWSLAEVENLDMRNRLFSNSLPYEMSEIPLGINIPKAGDYIFSLKHATKNENPTKEIESVVLWDKATDIKIELLRSDYYFKANSDFNAEDRFVLFFNSKDVNGLDKMPDLSEPYAYTDNNILTVKNLLTGDKVQVIDLTGRIIVSGVASENAFTAPLNQKGIYIINVKGGKTLKVLNK